MLIDREINWKGRKNDMLEIGSSYSESVVASERIIQDIARISGDVNLIHMDEEYAKDSLFGRRIAHALFCQNIISMIIGNHLPGNGAILISQTFHYRKPVFIGDIINVAVMIEKILPVGKYVLSTICRNQDDEIVLDGESVVKWEEK